MRAILEHLGLPTAGASLAPARAPPPQTAGGEAQHSQEAQAQRRANRLAGLIRREAGAVSLVTVESASFRGQLATVSGGRVSLAVRLGVLGEKPQNLQVTYDFHDPREDVKALVERRLGLPPLPLFS